MLPSEILSKGLLLKPYGKSINVPVVEYHPEAIEFLKQETKVIKMLKINKILIGRMFFFIL